MSDPKFGPDLLADKERKSQQAESERETNDASGQTEAKYDRYTYKKPDGPMFYYSSHGLFSFRIHKFTEWKFR